MPVRRLAKPLLPADDSGGIRETLAQFLQIKKAEDELKKRHAKVRGRIIELLSSDGVEDDNGSLLLPLEDLGLDGDFKLAKYERRISTSLDEDAAEDLLKAKRLYTKCTQTITVLDEDKISALWYEGKLTDDEYHSMYPQKETWAVKVQGA